MHQLAIALSRKGYQDTGSDDEIFEPARSKLEKQGILPAETGWDAGKIHEGPDAILLRMHAREDNPELQKPGSWALKSTLFPNTFSRKAGTKNGSSSVVVMGKPPRLP
jgi:UDP-N-acetylmuramate: L-alanyl-gamma-D-glutamyl-meso-diaminopimelate ligase